MARKKVRNIAKAPPIGAAQAISIANKEKELVKAKLDFDTVIKRVSDGGVGGLYHGSPPGTVA